MSDAVESAQKAFETQMIHHRIRACQKRGCDVHLFVSALEVMTARDLKNLQGCLRDFAHTPVDKNQVE